MLTTLVAALEVIGGVAGALITLGTFFAIITKKPKEWFRKVIREESIEANEEIRQSLEKIEERIKISDQTDLAVLRNEITQIYFKYKDTKEIPHYEKENALSLYHQYEILNGNSYIKTIMNEIKTWEEVI